MRTSPGDTNGGSVCILDNTLRERKSDVSTPSSNLYAAIVHELVQMLLIGVRNSLAT
jgi:hypothetical protein